MKHLSMFTLTLAAFLAFSFSIPMQAQAAESSVDATLEVSADETIDPTLTFEDTLFELINAERTKHGLASYVLDEMVDAASETRISELKSVFSHTRNGQKQFSTVLTEYGISFTAASETIAAGQTTPERVLNAWLDSPRHCSRILSSDYTKIGVAHDRAEDGTDYWEVLFLN